MEKKSKKQLLAVIEGQDEQLKRYEARLRDVVQAYKGLQKEKFALEKSLKVLSPDSKERLGNEPLREQLRFSNEHDQQSVGQGNDVKVATEPGASKENTNNQTDSCGSETKVQDEGGTASLSNLQAQVQTLRETLQTVMEQKSKMENSFQNDKKKYLQELEIKEDAFTEERNVFCNEKKILQQEIQELRNRTCQEQQARESEQNDHALMLKEMQLVVSKERLSNEELQTKLDRLNRSITSKDVQTSNGSPIEQDGNPNNQGDIEESGDKPQLNSSPTLLQLQEEMMKMKTQLEKDILSEQLRANEAEAKAAMIAKAEEQRVADLEAKLSELSDVVGKYEKLRLHDQTEIQKLKDRIHEFNTCSKDVDSIITDNRDVKNEENFDNDANITEVFQKVKEMLRSCGQNNDITESDLCGISKAELEYILKNDPAHKACQEELRQLKDEFECYKSKVQTIRTKNKHENDAANSEESVEKLRGQVSTLRSSLESLERDLECSENQRRLDTEHSKREITELCAKHNIELENEQTIYAAKLQELENQVRSQRSRTLALIAEKDCEIERLQHKLSEFMLTSDTRRGPSTYRRSSNSDTAVKELLSQTSPSPLVRFAEEQAFCEAELELLRKQRLEMEDTIRDMTHREEQTTEQVKLLKEEIRKLERNRSRENANLEYVKNVILRYLLTDSDSVRQQMVAAISQILEFSREELSNVKRKSQNSWWR